MIFKLVIDMAVIFIRFLNACFTIPYLMQNNAKSKEQTLQMNVSMLVSAL